MSSYESFSTLKVIQFYLHAILAQRILEIIDTDNNCYIFKAPRNQKKQEICRASTPII